MLRQTSKEIEPFADAQILADSNGPSLRKKQTMFLHKKTAKIGDVGQAKNAEKIGLLSSSSNH